jgi:ligand-binding SRPBCC domain-containing protein
MSFIATFEQWMPYPLERVFNFFGDPENLPLIMPAWMQVRVDNATLVAPSDAPSDRKFAGAGSVVAVSFRPIPFLPLRAQSNARIVAFEMNHLFEDVHSDALFKNWHHRHQFVPENRNGVTGTIARDVITYDLRFGPLSRLVNSFVVARQMRRTFEYRQRVVEHLLAQGR